MDNERLFLVYGGSSKISGTLFSGISKCLDSIIEAGRLLGTSIRMLMGGKTC